MLNTEINIAIDTLFGKRMTERWSPPATNYAGDLNEMANAEACLRSEEIGKYESFLYEICNYQLDNPQVFWSQHSLYRCIHATARQRAEAFLKVVSERNTTMSFTFPVQRKQPSIVS